MAQSLRPYPGSGSRWAGWGRWGRWVGQVGQVGRVGRVWQVGYVRSESGERTGTQIMRRLWIARRSSNVSARLQADSQRKATAANAQVAENQKRNTLRSPRAPRSIQLSRIRRGRCASGSLIDSRRDGIGGGGGVDRAPRVLGTAGLRVADGRADRGAGRRDARAVGGGRVRPRLRPVRAGARDVPVAGRDPRHRAGVHDLQGRRPPLVSRNSRRDQRTHAPRLPKTYGDERRVRKQPQRSRSTPRSFLSFASTITAIILVP